MALAIAYRLTGAGWAECEVTSADAHCKVTASYLSDALGTLLTAAVGALKGFTAVSFRFEEEPGEYRWSLRELDGESWSLGILWFEDSYGHLPDDDGRELISVRSNPVEFGIAVYRAAAQVLAEHGEAGYTKKWMEHVFPSEMMEMLKEELDRRGHET